MRTVTRGLVMSGALMLIGSSLGWAQQGPTRRGFWIGFGYGWESLSLSCGGCRGDRFGAASGYFKVGGTAGAHLLLGGEIDANGWTKQDTATTWRAANVSFTAYYYPKAAGNLFLKGGVGVATYEEVGADSRAGLGLIFGIGFDLRARHNVSITPVANYNWGKVGALATSRIRQSILQLAVGVTIH